MLTFITFTAAQHRGPTMAPRSPSAAPTRNRPSATWTDGLTEKPSLCNGLEHSGALRDIQEHCPKIQTISLGDWGSWVQIPPLRPTFSVPAHPAPPGPDRTDAGASCPIQPQLVTAMVGIGAAACRHAAFGLPSCLVAILVRRSLACATCGDGGSTAGTASASRRGRRQDHDQPRAYRRAARLLAELPPVAEWLGGLEAHRRP